MTRPRTKTLTLTWTALGVVALAVSTADTAEAGHRRRARCAPARAFACYPPAPCRAVSPVYASPQAGPAYASPSGPAPDGGVLAWLNGARQARGLRPLAWDASLAGLAASNSSAGFGHFTGGGGQVVGMGGLGAVESAWLASPSHYAILMSPRATSAGAATVGGITTINLR
jgi:uncharacterized protein YkwD